MVKKSRDKTTLEADTVGYMPERFIEGYHELVRLGLKIEPNAQQFDNESGTVKKKFHTPSGGLRDEHALRFKAWVDRQLRAIGRDVQAYLNARDSSGPSPINMSHAQRRKIARELERKTELKCGGCKKYISWQWYCCAWCGKRIVSDGTQVQGRPQGGRDDESIGGQGESILAVSSLLLGSSGEGEDADRADGGEARRDDAGAPGDDQGPGLEGSS